MHTTEKDFLPMIKDLFSQKQTLSFEVFPPKKDDEFTNAQNVLHQLSELQPDFHICRLWRRQPFLLHG